MASSAILAIRIISDATKAAREVSRFGDQTASMADRLDKASGKAKGLILGLGAIGLAAGKQASDLQQAQGAVESVFGKQAAAVDKLARSAATSVGLAQSEYSQIAATLGAQLGNLGVAQDKLVGTTDSLVTTGADLAAAFGGSTKDAVDALGAAMRGEADSVEKYGLSLGDARVQAELAKRGQADLKGAALDQAKTQVRLALITEQTSKIQGQFAREAGSAAGSQQIAMAQVKDAGARMGAVLLPLFAALMTTVAAVTAKVMEHQGAVQVAVAVVGGLAAAIIAANYAVKAYRATQVAITAVTKAWAVAQKLLNLAMKANPVLAIVSLVLLLVGAVVLAYKRSETFRKIVDGAFRAVQKAAAFAFNWVKDNWRTILAILTGPIGIAVGIITKHWGTIRTSAGTIITKVKDLAGTVKDRLSGAFTTMRDTAVRVWEALTTPIQAVVDKVNALIDAIRNIDWPSPPEWMKKAGGAVGNILPRYGLPGGSTTGTLPRMGAVGGTTIIIQGAVDPESTARQVARLLGDRDVRLGVA